MTTDWSVGGARIRPTTSPALNTLQRDQHELLYEGADARTPPIAGLVDGFEGTRPIINWYQAAIVRTLGYITREWSPADIMRDRALVDALTGESERDRTWRHVLVSTIVEDACEQAYRDLEKRADEWTDQEADSDTWENINAETERNPAFRPAFRLLDEEQARALSTLWGGFGDRDELAKWASSLKPVTEPHWDADRPLARRLLADDHAVERMLDQQSAAAGRWRESYAVVELLPAFGRAARQLQHRADEAQGGPRGRGTGGGSIS